MRRRVTTLDSEHTVEAVALSMIGHMLMVGAIAAYSYWIKRPPDIPEITYEFISRDQALAALGPLETARVEPADPSELAAAPAAAAVVDPAEPPETPVEAAVLQPPEPLQPPPVAPDPVVAPRPAATEAVDLPPPPPAAVERPQVEPDAIRRAQPAIAAPLETAAIVEPVPENLTPRLEPADVLPPSQAEAAVAEAAPAETQDIVVPAETPLVERDLAATVEPDIVQPEPPRPPETAELAPPAPETLTPADPVEVIAPPEPVAAVEEEPADTVAAIEPGPLPAIPPAKPRDIPTIDPVPPAPEPETATEKLFSTIGDILSQAKNPPAASPSRAPAAGDRNMDPVERRALNTHLKRNFDIDCGAKYPEQYEAVINVRLLPRGQIQNWEYAEETERLARTDAFGRRFVEAARRALLSAAPFPYDILKPETYQHWKEMKLVFRLGDLCD